MQTTTRDVCYICVRLPFLACLIPDNSAPQQAPTTGQQALNLFIYLNKELFYEVTVFDSAFSARVDD